MRSHWASRPVAPCVAPRKVKANFCSSVLIGSLHLAMLSTAGSNAVAPASEEPTVAALAARKLVRSEAAASQSPLRSVPVRGLPSSLLEAGGGAESTRRSAAGARARPHSRFIRKGKACVGERWYLGKAATMLECQEKAIQHGNATTLFNLGYGKRQGQCYAERLRDYERCKRWAPAQFEVYEILAGNIAFSDGQCDTLETPYNLINGASLNRHFLQCHQDTYMKGWSVRVNRTTNLLQFQYTCCRGHVVGDCSNEATPVAYDEEGHNPVWALKDHTVQCPTKHALSSFWIEHGKGPKEGFDTWYRVHYKCCYDSHAENLCKMRDTAPTDAQKDDLRVLEHHQATCKKTEYLKHWHIKRMDKTVWLEYTCCQLKQVAASKMSEGLV